MCGGFVGDAVDWFVDEVLDDFLGVVPGRGGLIGDLLQGADEFLFHGGLEDFLFHGGLEKELKRWGKDLEDWFIHGGAEDFFFHGGLEREIRNLGRWIDDEIIQPIYEFQKVFVNTMIDDPLYGIAMITAAVVPGGTAFVPYIQAIKVKSDGGTWSDAIKAGVTSYVTTNYVAPAAQDFAGMVIPPGMEQTFTSTLETLGFSSEMAAQVAGGMFEGATVGMASGFTEVILGGSFEEGFIEGIVQLGAQYAASATMGAIEENTSLTFSEKQFEKNADGSTKLGADNKPIPIIDAATGKIKTEFKKVPDTVRNMLSAGIAAKITNASDDELNFAVAGALAEGVITTKLIGSTLEKIPNIDFSGERGEAFLQVLTPQVQDTVAAMMAFGVNEETGAIAANNFLTAIDDYGQLQFEDTLDTVFSTYIDPIYAQFTDAIDNMVGTRDTVLANETTLKAAEEDVRADINEFNGIELKLEELSTAYNDANIMFATGPSGELYEGSRKKFMDGLVIGEDGKPTGEIKEGAIGDPARYFSSPAEYYESLTVGQVDDNGQPYKSYLELERGIALINSTGRELTEYLESTSSDGESTIQERREALVGIIQTKGDAYNNAFANYEDSLDALFTRQQDLELVSKPALDYVNQAVVQVQFPHFDAEEYKDINNIDAAIDGLDNFIEEGIAQGLYVSNSHRDAVEKHAIGKFNSIVDTAIGIDRQKLTVQELDTLNGFIDEYVTNNFYDDLGNLKTIDKINEAWVAGVLDVQNQYDTYSLNGFELPTADEILNREAQTITLAPNVSYVDVLLNGGIGYNEVTGRKEYVSALKDGEGYEYKLINPETGLINPISSGQSLDELLDEDPTTFWGTIKEVGAGIVAEAKARLGAAADAYTDSVLLKNEIYWHSVDKTKEFLDEDLPEFVDMTNATFALAYSDMVSMAMDEIDEWAGKDADDYKEDLANLAGAAFKSVIYFAKPQGFSKDLVDGAITTTALSAQGLAGLAESFNGIVAFFGKDPSETPLYEFTQNLTRNFDDWKSDEWKENANKLNKRVQQTFVDDPNTTANEAAWSTIKNVAGAFVDQPLAFLGELIYRQGIVEEVLPLAVGAAVPRAVLYAGTVAAGKEIASDKAKEIAMAMGFGAAASLDIAESAFGTAGEVFATAEQVVYDSLVKRRDSGAIDYTNGQLRKMAKQYAQDMSVKAGIRAGLTTAALFPIYGGALEKAVFKKQDFGGNQIYADAFNGLQASADKKYKEWLAKSGKVAGKETLAEWGEEHAIATYAETLYYDWDKTRNSQGEAWANSVLAAAIAGPTTLTLAGINEIDFGLNAGDTIPTFEDLTGRKQFVSTGDTMADLLLLTSPDVMQAVDTGSTSIYDVLQDVGLTVTTIDTLVDAANDPLYSSGNNSLFFDIEFDIGSDVINLDSLEPNVANFPPTPDEGDIHYDPITDATYKRFGSEWKPTKFGDQDKLGRTPEVFTQANAGDLSLVYGGNNYSYNFDSNNNNALYEFYRDPANKFSGQKERIGRYMIPTEMAIGNITGDYGMNVFDSEYEIDPLTGATYQLNLKDGQLSLNRYLPKGYTDALGNVYEDGIFFGDLIKERDKRAFFMEAISNEDQRYYNRKGKDAFFDEDPVAIELERIAGEEFQRYLEEFLILHQEIQMLDGIYGTDNSFSQSNISARVRDDAKSGGETDTSASSAVAGSWSIGGITDASVLASYYSRGTGKMREDNYGTPKYFPPSDTYSVRNFFTGEFTEYQITHYGDPTTNYYGQPDRYNNGTKVLGPVNAMDFPTGPQDGGMYDETALALDFLEVLNNQSESAERLTIADFMDYINPGGYVTNGRGEYIDATPLEDAKIGRGIYRYGDITINPDGTATKTWPTFTETFYKSWIDDPEFGFPSGNLSNNARFYDPIEEAVNMKATSIENIKRLEEGGLAPSNQWLQYIKPGYTYNSAQNKWFYRGSESDPAEADPEEGIQEANFALRKLAKDNEGKLIRDESGNFVETGTQNFPEEFVQTYEDLIERLYPAELYPSGPPKLSNFGYNYIDADELSDDMERSKLDTFTAKALNSGWTRRETYSYLFRNSDAILTRMENVNTDAEFDAEFVNNPSAGLNLTSLDRTSPFASSTSFKKYLVDQKGWTQEQADIYYDANQAIIDGAIPTMTSGFIEENYGAMFDNAVVTDEEVLNTLKAQLGADFADKSDSWYRSNFSNVFDSVKDPNVTYLQDYQGALTRNVQSKIPDDAALQALASNYAANNPRFTQEEIYAALKGDEDTFLQRANASFNYVGYTSDGIPVYAEDEYFKKLADEYAADRTTTRNEFDIKLRNQIGDSAFDLLSNADLQTLYDTYNIADRNDTIFSLDLTSVLADNIVTTALSDSNLASFSDVVDVLTARGLSTAEAEDYLTNQVGATFFNALLSKNNKEFAENFFDSDNRLADFFVTEADVIAEFQKERPDYQPSQAELDRYSGYKFGDTLPSPLAEIDRLYVSPTEVTEAASGLREFLALPLNDPARNSGPFDIHQYEYITDPDLFSQAELEAAIEAGVAGGNNDVYGILRDYVNDKTIDFFDLQNDFLEVDLQNEIDESHEFPPNTGQNKFKSKYVDKDRAGHASNLLNYLRDTYGNVRIDQVPDLYEQIRNDQQYKDYIQGVNDQVTTVDEARSYLEAAGFDTTGMDDDAIKATGLVGTNLIQDDGAVSAAELTTLGNTYLAPRQFTESEAIAAVKAELGIDPATALDANQLAYAKSMVDLSGSQGTNTGVNQTNVIQDRINAIKLAFGDYNETAEDIGAYLSDQNFQTGVSSFLSNKQFTIDEARSAVKSAFNIAPEDPLNANQETFAQSLVVTSGVEGTQAAQEKAVTDRISAIQSAFGDYDETDTEISNYLNDSNFASNISSFIEPKQFTEDEAIAAVKAEFGLAAEDELSPAQLIYARSLKNLSGNVYANNQAAINAVDAGVVSASEARAYFKTLGYSDAEIDTNIPNLKGDIENLAGIRTQADFGADADVLALYNATNVTAEEALAQLKSNPSAYGFSSAQAIQTAFDNDELDLSDYVGNYRQNTLDGTLLGDTVSATDIRDYLAGQGLDVGRGTEDPADLLNPYSLGMDDLLGFGDSNDIATNQTVINYVDDNTVTETEIKDYLRGLGYSDTDIDAFDYSGMTGANKLDTDAALNIATGGFQAQYETATQLANRLKREGTVAAFRALGYEPDATEIDTYLDNNAGITGYVAPRQFTEAQAKAQLATFGIDENHSAYDTLLSQLVVTQGLSDTVYDDKLALIDDSQDALIDPYYFSVDDARAQWQNYLDRNDTWTPTGQYTDGRHDQVLDGETEAQAFERIFGPAERDLLKHFTPTVQEARNALVAAGYDLDSVNRLSEQAITDMGLLKKTGWKLNDINTGGSLANRIQFGDTGAYVADGTTRYADITTTAEEARTRLAALGLTQATAKDQSDNYIISDADLSEFIGNYDAIKLDALINTEGSYFDQNVVNVDEARAALDLITGIDAYEEADGEYVITDAQLAGLGFTGEYNESADLANKINAQTITAAEAEAELKNVFGSSYVPTAEEIALFTGIRPETDLGTQVTNYETQQFQTLVGDVQGLDLTVGALEAQLAGIIAAGGTIDTALAQVASNLGTTENYLKGLIDANANKFTGEIQTALDDSKTYTDTQLSALNDALNAAILQFGSDIDSAKIAVANQLGIDITRLEGLINTNANGLGALGQDVEGLESDLSNLIDQVGTPDAGDGIYGLIDNLTLAGIDDPDGIIQSITDRLTAIEGIEEADLTALGIIGTAQDVAGANTLYGYIKQQLDNRDQRLTDLENNLGDPTTRDGIYALIDNLAAADYTQEQIEGFINGIVGSRDDNTGIYSYIDDLETRVGGIEDEISDIDDFIDAFGNPAGTIADDPATEDVDESAATGIYKYIDDAIANGTFDENTINNFIAGQLGNPADTFEDDPNTPEDESAATGIYAYADNIDTTTAQQLADAISGLEDYVDTQGFFAGDEESIKDLVAQVMGKPSSAFVTQDDIDLVTNMLTEGTPEYLDPTDLTGLTPEQRVYDLNADGIVDQSDLDILTSLSTDEYVGTLPTDSQFAPTGVFGTLSDIQNQQALDAQAAIDQQNELETELNNKIQTAIQMGNVQQLQQLMAQADDLGGQQVQARTPQPGEIKYMYDFESIFANPEQERLYGDLFGGGKAAASGGLITDDTDRLLKIIGE